MKWVKVKVRNWGVESQPHMHRLIWRVLCNILDIEEIRISQIIHPMDKFSGNFQMKIREAKFFRFKIFVYIKLIVLLSAGTVFWICSDSNPCWETEAIRWNKSKFRALLLFCFFFVFVLNAVIILLSRFSQYVKIA